MTDLLEPGIYETFGENRSGKSAVNALFAYLAYLRGIPVYYNCPRDPSDKQRDHIPRFPHYDYDPMNLFKLGLFGVCVVTDEAGEFMNARRGMSQLVDELISFNYQAKKRRIIWRFDTIRKKRIDINVRLNPDYILETRRVPRDWHKPLVAIRVRVTPRYGKDFKFTIRHAWRLFTLYDHEVQVFPELAA